MASNKIHFFPFEINDLACGKAVQGEDGVHVAYERLQFFSCPEKNSIWEPRPS